MHNRDFFGYLALAFLTAAFGAGIYYYGFAPQVFRVAAPPPGSELTQLFNGMAAALKHENTRIRLVVVPYETNEAIISSMESGKTDLAIARTDLPLPSGSLGVAELQEMTTLILARPGSGIESFADLKGRSVGELTRSAPGKGVFAEIAAFNNIKSGEINFVAIRSPPALVAAVAEHKLDAILIVAPRGARLISESMRILTSAFGGEPKLVAIKEAKAIAARIPAIEAGEFAAGELSLNPQIPTEIAATLTFPVLLVAQQKASNNTIQDLARQLFNVRNSVTAQYPAAARMAALDTERGATFAVHPGAAIYYDASESTLLERYSDMLWLVLFGFSTIVSAIVWFLRRLFPQQTHKLRTEHSELIKMLDDVRAAQDVAILDAAEARIDNIVAGISRLSLDGKIDEEQMPAFDLIIQRVEKVIEGRREQLGKS